MKFVATLIFTLSFCVWNTARAAVPPVTCRISVASDLKEPLNFDKVLWESPVDLKLGLHFLIDKNLGGLTPMTEAQAFDPAFLKEHEGQVAVAIGKPFPHDKESGNVVLAVSTIELAQAHFRAGWINALGHPGAELQATLMLTDLSRHVNTSCRLSSL